MKQNRLFSRSRWRLASWYAAILSIVLLICALGVYEAVAHAHRITINQELKQIYLSAVRRPSAMPTG
ncbi:MAG: hypothetical protein QNJ70_31140 [Xenococcaceae cyanobacterium MO_207.B15]|nr:hypothetical protein [Xenococcaceae cyanobacterium MO_207.B15]